MIRLLVIALFSFGVYASGTMQLSGSVRSFTADTIELSDGAKIYTLNRKSLGPQDPAKNLKTGMKLALNIPFNAITAVKNAK
jgi:hypothetical protein